MFEPLRELAAGDPRGLVAEPRVLGEKAGRLFALSELADYRERGGAVYPDVEFASSTVVAWQTRASGGVRRDVTDVVRDVWRLPQRALHDALRVLACIVPAVRTFCPTAVPSYHQSLSCRRAAASPERVSAIAFHPSRMLVAVAVREGGDDEEARVVVYDVSASRRVCVLRHAFQKSVAALAWKPWARGVLAVGCRAGVLLWSIGEQSASCSSAHDTFDDVLGRGGALTRRDETAPTSAWALFYPCARNVRVTSLGFSCREGRYVACGSLDTTQLFILDVSRPPSDPSFLVSHASPSVDGAPALALFADDDTFVLSTVHQHPSLALTRLGEAHYGPAVVGLPAPVQTLVKAPGLGANHFVLHTEHLEGVIIAHVDPAVGVEVVRVIATGLCRGVGGRVCALACSARRLWLAVETGHLLICHYSQSAAGVVNLIPVGVTEMEVTQLASFDNFARGSLLAVVEREMEVRFVPSYHA